MNIDRELLLLGLLRQSGMHGYRIVEFIERDLAVCTDLKKSNAYFLLDKMAQGGLVTWAEEREGNRPPRRTYQITPAGETQFQKLLRAESGALSAAQVYRRCGAGIL